MQAILEALNSINYSISHPTGWEIASVMISAVSLLIAIIVLVYNHKSISIAQKSIKQAVDLQLYEKRLELFNWLQGATAFETIPVEMKIVYSDQVYNLCLEISELCCARESRLRELATVDRLIDWRNPRFYNVHEEVMQLVDGVLNRCKNAQDSNERRIDSLQDLRSAVLDYTMQIKEKFVLLQTIMEKELKESIKNEG